ncbi:MAG: hypothetical protein ACT4OU_10620 [Hyphomicrobium sp.]
MGTDYAEKEREFIGALGEDTGTSLDGWMAAISDTGLSDRNAIIDWLRHQGFAFSRASWLERIHHNGGRLIYGDDAAPIEQAALVQAEEPPPRVTREARRETPLAAPAPTALQHSADISALLSSAKGLRPLAELVLREIASVVPATRYEAKPPFVVASVASPYLALWPQSKQLRLYGDFSGWSASDVRDADPVLRQPPPFPNVLPIDDARRVDPAFRGLISAAARAKA